MVTLIHGLVGDFRKRDNMELSVDSPVYFRAALPHSPIYVCVSATAPPVEPGWTGLRLGVKEFQLVDEELFANGTYYQCTVLGLADEAGNPRAHSQSCYNGLGWQPCALCNLKNVRVAAEEIRCTLGDLGCSAGPWIACDLCDLRRATDKLIACVEKLMVTT